MSKAYEFLKECGYFYILTINSDYPAGRPSNHFSSAKEEKYLLFQGEVLEVEFH